MAKEEYTKEDLISLKEEGKVLVSASVSRDISFGTMFLYFSFIKYPEVFNLKIETLPVKELLPVLSILIGGVGIFFFTFVLVSLLQSGFFFNFNAAFSPYGLMKSKIKRPVQLRISEQAVMPVILSLFSIVLSLIFLKFFSFRSINFVRMYLGSLGGLLLLVGVISLIAFRLSMNKAVLRELSPDLH